ncbi:uncharacterized protein BJ212DRAFT_1305081 [Suillus subaureus]|uniref:DUF6532 domain-containing protein n=1 Tax=Suillus subaureus TaxID=48587 RepID=A0A9P7DRA4_9AGAM|nr:uncharacterized protein BJ212DRAFT_1305081 [Suillus subaureus]KAG1801238.1 hypothetical protein BJ212DRAFT_1305081 [Suillus subaureus]
MPSPKKSRGKRKGQDLDNGPPAGQVKKIQTPRTHNVEAADSHPALSDELCGPQHSGSSRKQFSKGSTSFSPNILNNPQAPEPCRVHKSKKGIAPPPYTAAERNSMDICGPPSIVPPGTDNPYAAAMGQIPHRNNAISCTTSTINPCVTALPPSTAPSHATSAQLEPRFPNTLQCTYQPDAPTMLLEHFIDPALQTQVSSTGASAPRFSNTPQYVNQSFVQSQAAVLQRLLKPVTGPALQTKNHLLMSDESDPEDSGSTNSDESSAHEDTEEEDEGADRDTDIGNWEAFGGCCTSHPDEGNAAAALASAQPKWNVQYLHDEDNAITNLTSAQPKPKPTNQSETNVQHEAPPSRSEVKLTQLGWYKNGWKSFLEEVKGECHTVHTLDNPFPNLIKDLPCSITEVLVSLKTKWEKTGKQVESSVWPVQKFNMARLRSELKKVIISLVPRMLDLIPPDEVPAHEHLTWVQNAALELCINSLFLQNRYDSNVFVFTLLFIPHDTNIWKQGKTNNFANPALREVIALFYYTGSYRIAQKRLDLFRHQLPLSCLALITTVFDCVLLGFSKNGSGKIFLKFTVKEYEPIYKEMMEMIQLILKDEYHSPKLIKQLEEWAAYGWSQSLKLDGCGLQARPDHLKVVLD